MEINDDYGYRLGIQDGRRDAKSDGDARTVYTLQAKGFGLASGLDDYARGFRSGYFEGVKNG